MSRRRQKQKGVARESAAAARSAAPPPSYPPHPQVTRARTARVTAIDALRGVAICLMIVYHFSFDLRFFRVTSADFERDPFWLGFRALIVASFMVLVGISLVLADTAGSSRKKFWQRIGFIAAGALAATIGSYLVFPRSFIYFGVLHCIVVASVLAWPVVRRPTLALAIGLAIVVAGLTLTHPVFDQRPLSWLGFTTAKPTTEDYVPLLPWAGVVFIGIAIGHALTRTHFRILSPLTAAPRWLQWLGRHSLAVYLLHQPLLMGVLWIALGR